MKDISYFSSNVVSKFDNKYENMLVFNDLMMNASNDVYDRYSKSETSEIIRNQFNNILGINYKTANRMERRQAWRQHGMEVCSVIENVLADKMNSGWDGQNSSFFTNLVEDVNIARGDINYFTTQNTALL